MDTTQVKLPHHLSHEYKGMVEKGLINANKEYVGTVDLAVYLQSLRDGNEIENPTNIEIVEPSIPISQVQGMLERMFAEQMSKMAPSEPQAAKIFYEKNKNDIDIDDLPEFKNWIVKDREYELAEGKPISCSITSKHSKEIPLQYYNKDTNTVHTLRYSTNQPSFFIEKQSKEEGSVLISEIIFHYGRLRVPAENIVLQKFLAIHPHKNITFKEYDATEKSAKIVNAKKLKIEAGALVFKVGETMNRAIASLVCPSYVESWKSEILEEEILAYAEREPSKYIAFTEDSTVKMKGVIKSALAKGDLIYQNYRFLNSKREVILEVAKNQDELEEMVKHFESGVGRTTYEFLLNSQN